jgi:2-haloalkanoic acid dehalogenase type II
VTVAPRLADFEAFSFDCYGTLIDWEQGIWDATAAWRDRTGLTPDRDDLLEAFAQLESAAEAAQPRMPYPEILATVLRGLGRHFGEEASDAEAAAFGRSVGDWPAFPDSGPALRSLAPGHTLIILSNVDRRSFAASREQLGATFDAIVTAQDVGSYKPDARNFTALLELARARGIRVERLLHVAQSLFHDHVPAKSAGLATAWIDRRGHTHGSGATPPPGDQVEPDFVFPSMAAFAGAVTADARDA